MAAPVIIYTTPWCGYCRSALALLQRKQVAFDNINVAGNSQLRAEIAQRSGSYTVPQIWIGDQYIGGCNELYALEYHGELDALLTGNNNN